MFAFTGFDINGCRIARGKWKRHPTCPIGQVKMILWYVQFLNSKMINIELFTVGSRDKFYINIASYVSCILCHFVDYGIPLSQIKIMVVSQTTFGDLLFLLRFLLLLLLFFFLFLLFSFLSVHHELVHGRSQELHDRISWNLVEL